MENDTNSTNGTESVGFGKKLSKLWREEALPRIKDEIWTIGLGMVGIGILAVWSWLQQTPIVVIAVCLASLVLIAMLIIQLWRSPRWGLREWALLVVSLLLVAASGVLYYIAPPVASKAIALLKSENETIAGQRDRALSEKFTAQQRVQKLNTTVERLTQQRDMSVLELDAARERLDDREQQKKKQLEIAKWMDRIEAFQNSLSSEQPPTSEEFNALTKEFTEWAAHNLDEGERMLLKSAIGLPQHFTHPNLQGIQLEMFKILWRWGLRLNQYRFPGSPQSGGIIPGIIP